MVTKPLVAALLLLGPTGLASAAERTLPLSGQEVDCEAKHLARVQRRLTSVGAGQIVISLGTNSIWPNTGAGGITGLARLRNLGGNAYNDFVSGNEHFEEIDLAFNALFTHSQSTLNPDRIPAPQATLVRRDPGSNLLLDHEVDNLNEEPGCCISTDPTCTFDLTCPMVVNFDLAAKPADSVKPKVPLLINSSAAATPAFAGPLAQFLPADSATGPGVQTDRLDQDCGARLTAFDDHVFEILARTLAPSDCYHVGSSDCRNFGYGLEAFNLSIFRGADPHTYRVDIYILQYLCDGDDCYSTTGPVALEFRINWDSRGILTDGEVRVLPECRGTETRNCSAPAPLNDAFGLFVLPPIYPGHEQAGPSSFVGAPYLFPTSNASHQVLFSKINWRALLKNTGLNEPWR